MTLPVSGSQEALWGSLAYHFQQDIANPLNLDVHWPGSGFVAATVTVWLQPTLTIVERRTPMRSHPGRENRLGRVCRANFDIKVLVRDEAQGHSQRNTRRAMELADAIGERWPMGTSLPRYNTRIDTVGTEIYGSIHVMDVQPKPCEPSPNGVFGHDVRFVVQFLEESER